MAEESASIHMCDIHHDDIAQAFCRYHKKLLCLSCVLEKAKSSECSITEIRRLSENDSALLDCLEVKQIGKRKKQLIEEHEKKTDTIKNKLEQQVIEMHGNLTQRLDEMKEKSLKLIDKQARNLTVGNEHYRQRLALFNTSINEHIDKLSADSTDDISDILIKVKDLEKNLIENVPDKDTTPEGEFKPNAKLSEIILQSDILLGCATLIEQQWYDKIDDESVSAQEITENTVDLTSDEVIYDRKGEKKNSVGNDVKSETTSSGGSVENQSKQNIDIAVKSGTISTDGKPGKQTGGILKWIFQKDKKKTDHWDGSEKRASTNDKDDKGKNSNARKRPSESGSVGAENIYQESTFYTSDYVHPKYLINKKVEVAALKRHFTSACKFFKLVDIGDGCIGMLSEFHSSVVVVRTDGQVLGQKTNIKEGKLAITAIGNKQIAVIAECGLQVTKFKVTDKALATAGSFIVPEEMIGITGFDFDTNSSTFAVSSVDKVIVLDKKGKKLKTLQYGPTTATKEVATTYDFKSNCLYFLNIDDKTLKCYSFEKSDALWKRRLSPLSAPRTMCLYKDKLCIACKEGIAIFSATIGAPVVKRDTKELLDDCLGVCVIDDVLVISSNSDDLEKSTTLAYISL